MRQIFCIIALVCAGPLWADVSDADMADCRAAPSTDCLADIGFALGMDGFDMDQQAQGVSILAEIGRLEDARALGLRLQNMHGVHGELAESVVDLTLSNYRLIEAFMDGKGIEEALDGRAPLWAMSAMLHLAGVSGLGNLTPVPSQDPDRIAVLRDLLLPPTGSRLDRIITADILLTVGEKEAARRVLEDLPVDASRRSNLGDPMIELIGAKRTLEIYEGMGDIPVFYLGRLVPFAEDNAFARQVLNEMFDRAKAAEDQYRRLADLRQVVAVAADAGHRDIADAAMDLLRDDVDPDGPNVRFLILALSHIGAPEDEMRQALKRAEKSIANLEEESAISNRVFLLVEESPRLGEIKRVARLLDRTDSDARHWGTFLSAEMSESDRKKALRQAKRRLGAEDYHAALSRAASTLAFEKRSKAETDLALEMVRDLLTVTPPSGTYDQGYFYDRLLNVGWRLGDRGLIGDILQRSAETALESGRVEPILHAAYQYHVMGERLAW
ncbi:MAG: hypothetical protein AAGK71_04415 [Pseudomonadota bacterium]